MKYYLILSLFLLLAFSCKQIVTPIKEKIALDSSNNVANTFDYELKFKYTSNIKLENRKEYQIVTLMNPWNEGEKWISYLIYPKEVSPDTSWPVTDYKIAVPVDRIAVVAASSIGFLDELNQLSKVKAISQYKFVYNPHIRQEVEKGTVKEISGGEQMNIEQLLASKSNVFIQTPFSVELSNDKKIKNTGIPIVYNCDWLETNPLGRAEWIKFISLLLRKEKMADSIFTSIESRYNELKDLASKLDTNVDFLVGGLYKDVWYMPAGGSYKASLFKDAATNYSWMHTVNIASLPLSIETVIKQQLNADYWIEAPYKTFDEIEASNSRYAVFKAFKEKKVYHFLKQSHSDGANNYWERGVCRPDEILSDLISIFHPDDYQSPLYYYDNVK
jgi:iron complex transport system substrate-binding protein